MGGYDTNLCDIAKSGPLIPSPQYIATFSQSLQQQTQLVDVGLPIATIPFFATVARLDPLAPSPQHIATFASL